MRRQGGDDRERGGHTEKDQALEHRQPARGLRLSERTVLGHGAGLRKLFRANNFFCQKPFWSLSPKIIPTKCKSLKQPRQAEEEAISPKSFRS